MTAGPPSPGGPVVAALVGAGRMGEIHAVNAVDSPSLDLRYVVDDSADRAGRLAAAVGARAATLDEVLADPEVGAAIVATSTDAHEAVVRRLVGRGITVLCEKPLTGDVASSAALAQDAAEAGVAVRVGFHKRFDPALGQLRRVLRGGRIGELVSLTVTSRDPRPPSDGYAVGGGLFFDMMIHDFDLVGWLVDDRPVAVLARRSGDVGRCIIDVEGGASVSLECGRRSVSSYDQGVEAIGTVGAVRILDDESVVTTTFRGAFERRERWSAPRVGDPAGPFFLPRYHAAFRAELDDLGVAATGGLGTGAGADDGVRAARLAAAATESAAIAAAVPLDPSAAAAAADRRVTSA